MTPWDTIGTLILGVWKERHFQQWVKAWTSLLLSAGITFAAIWGGFIVSSYSTLGAIGCLTVGFGTALLAASGAAVTIALRNPKFKEIGLFFPGSVKQAIADMERQSGTIYDPNRQD